MILPTTIIDESHAATVTIGHAPARPHPACYSRSADRKSGCPHAAAVASDHEVHYSRLFDGPFEAHSDDALKELAKKMEGNGGRDDAKGTPAGVVYLGQFIAHDITRDRTPLNEEPFPSLAERRNHRTALLDLESVYGDGPVDPWVGPDRKKHRYVQLRPGEEKFWLGLTEEVTVDGVKFSSKEADLPRYPDNTSNIPDDRNDDNVILSQLHVLFLRFHNTLVDSIVASDSVIPVPPGQTPFEWARRLVKWHYHWLVRKYFLPSVVLQSVLDDIERNGPKLFNPQSAKSLSLPVEFTMAAFRFGHSMIGERYLINKWVMLEANKILNSDHQLSAAYVLDWPRFVGLGQTANLAQKINTTVSQALFGLPPQTIGPYRENPGPPTEAGLPVRSLLRGSRVGLPSGQEACALAGAPLINVDASHRHHAVLKKCELLDRLPLWYYILHEAEVAGIDDSLPPSSRQAGCRLGPLGSRIVAEVLLGLLRVDEDTYPDEWNPPMLRFPNQTLKQITGLRELVEFLPPLG